MAKQQRQRPRQRKLHSKQQIGARIQRRRIPTPPDYDREAILTANQQAWTRAFTTSMSAWRSRRIFYKDHLKAEIQAEREAIATKAAYDAERLAQRKADEQEEAERKTEQRAEEEEEKAGAWAHKAWKMHRAGREGRKLNHEYYGWDQGGEDYLCDLKTEKLLARAKAKRMAARRAELLAAGENPGDAYDTDKDSELDNSDSEGSAGPRGIAFRLEAFRSPSGLPSRSPPRPAPVIERAAVVDWREKTRAGVVKKKLSVSKAWGAITWNQKSNIQERLLVLEDDGYDISDLLDGKISSEDVTNIVLARAAGEQPSVSRAAQPLVQPGPASPPQAESLGLPPDWLESEMLAELLGPAAEASTPRSPSAPPPGSPASSGQQSDQEPKDTTQPFSFDEPYYPQPSRHLKRKRYEGDDFDIEHELALASPVPKKLKVQYVTDDELAAQALQDIKRTVLGGIFRSAREIDRKPLPLSRIVFSAESPSTFTKTQGARHSRLDYLYPETSRCRPIRVIDDIGSRSRASGPDEIGKLELASLPTSYAIGRISKCALENIMAELRYLLSCAEGSIRVEITDPDYDEDLIHTPVKPEERIRQGLRMMQRQASQITITIDSPSQTTLRGDALVLAELLKALRRRELLHYAGWEWDGLRLRRSSGLSWHLSPQTQETIVKVEGRLERRSRTGEIEIIVGVVDNGRTDNA